MSSDQTQKQTSTQSSQQIRTWDNRQDPAWKNAARLYYHCLLKGFQLGSIVGVTVVSPVVILKNYVFNKDLRMKNDRDYQRGQLFKYQIYSILGGITLSFGMCTAKLIKWDNREVKLQDRAYRLHYNQTQNRANKFSYFGSALGGILGAVSFGTGLAPIVACASYGTTAAILAHVASKKKPQQ